MNITELHKKLIAAARSHPPAESVPYAFEKRVMAHLPGKKIADFWAVWAAGLWRAAVPCVALTLLLSAWTFFGADSGAPSNDLSQEFDNTVLSAAVPDQASDLIW